MVTVLGSIRGVGQYWGSGIVTITSLFPDPIPGAVTFRVESDSNSSIYVEWNAITANTDLLLLRYEVKVCPHSTNLVNNCTNLRFLSDTTAYIVQDLEAHTIYSVGVAASLPGGTSANTVEVEVSTFPNGEHVGMAHWCGGRGMEIRNIFVAGVASSYPEGDKWVWPMTCAAPPT